MNRLLAGFLICLFILVLFAIMYNLFSAIMLVSLSMAKAQLTAQGEISNWSIFKTQAKQVVSIIQDNIEFDTMKYFPGWYVRKELWRQEYEQQEEQRRALREIRMYKKKLASGEYF